VVNRLAADKPLPSNSVCLTFDDGLAGVYRNAFPILREYGYPAVLFLVTGYCGQKNNWPGQPEAFQEMPMVSWEQVRELDAGGVTIGAHTINHPRLDQMSSVELQREIRGANEAITACIDKPVEWFAYPYGRYNSLVRKEVQSLYRGACSTQLDIIKNDSNRFLLPRIDAYYLLNPFAFRLLTRRAFPVYLAFRRFLRSIGGFAYDRFWN
jgi:peptidoglycan/xylan/chitin deacetylase (PgdA/CDA1 family)